ncbi:MAG TPA: mechanosensitive ion channel [Saprospiraceae bacterium]|nr:mechanosensitive ion channel [Saprospiraceae bacterium]
MNFFITVLKYSLKLLALSYLLYLKNAYLDKNKLPDLYYTPVVNSILHFLIYALGVNLIIRITQLIYRKRKKLGDKYSDNVITGLQNIYYLLIGIGLIVMLVGFFGIEFSKLLTGLSIVAAAIAIISKEIVTDVLCGIGFTFSKDMAIGDYVRIGDMKGKIIDINLNRIVLQSDDDDVIYINNTRAYNTEIVNYTQKEIRKYNVNFSLSQDRAISKEELLSMVKLTLSNYHEFVESDSVHIKLMNITKDEIQYKVQFKLNQVKPEIADQIKVKLMELLLKRIMN